MRQGEVVMERKRNKPNKIVIGSIIAGSLIIGFYLGMSIFFTNHFYFGTEINNVNATGKTVSEVESEVVNQINDYSLDLEGRDDVNQEIKGSDIDIKFIPDEKIQQIKDNQNAFAWIFSLFKKDSSEAKITVAYDEDLLKQTFDKLSFFDTKTVIDPQNAKLKYTDNGYEVIEAVDGNKVIKDVLYQAVVDAVNSGQTKIVLDSINSYETPKYTSKSEEITKAKEQIDKYMASAITYSFDKNNEIVNGEIIKDCIDVSDNLEVSLSKAKVRKYVDKLATQYNTYQSTRDFKTSTGKAVKVSGGNYGWILDKTKMVDDIIEGVSEGQVNTKQPVYAQTAKTRGNNDIGDSYLEVNLTKQHIWLYKNGALVIDSDVVTGNESLNCATPVGVYRLNYKEANATLKGEDYSTPVAYWMPFNGNIGIHDAVWRDQFGGQIYKTNGSHGCVNAPTETAKKVFENIEAGTAVVCYTE